MKIKKIIEHGFEEILVATDPPRGFQAIIAVHDTRLGPALGGIRMFRYRNDGEALQDVKRLAKAMTYKAAAADLKLGGGKAVILGDPNRDKHPDLFRWMGEFVNHFQGRYFAAKDSGVVTEDLVTLSEETPYVSGLPESMGGSGDPSPWTSLGVLEAIKVCVARKLGRKDLEGVTVLVQGIGHVGWTLGELLKKEGADLMVADICRDFVSRAKLDLEAEPVAPDRIFDVACDVFAPCALGGVIHDGSLPHLKCSVVAGGANNQLEDEARHGKGLMARGILYAPDYVVNAGGLINIYVRDILKEKDSRPWIMKIGDRLREIFRHAEEARISPAEAANDRTEATLRAVPTSSGTGDDRGKRSVK